MKIKKIPLILIFGTLMITVLFAGCTSTNYQNPQLTITQPQNGATLSTGNITITIQVSNFNLVNKLEQANVAGEGHINYFIDVAPPTTSGQPANTAVGTYASTIATSNTWQNVTTGQHSFSVELVNNDHTPLVPPVTATVMVTVTSSGGGQTAVVYLKAQNMAFNRSTISVPASATVTIHFTNDDSGIPHNFAVYTTSATKTIIFKGTIINGVSSTTYTFTAPSTPGTYFFRCDVHPSMMTGSFIVT